MAWISRPGLPGKVYVPENAGSTPKKHPCENCFSCQWCDDNRCRICRCEGAQVDEPTTKRCCIRKK